MLNEHNFCVSITENVANVEEHFGEVYLLLTYLYLCLKDILYIYIFLNLTMYLIINLTYPWRFL